MGGAGYGCSVRGGMGLSRPLVHPSWPSHPTPHPPLVPHCLAMSIPPPPFPYIVGLLKEGGHTKKKGNSLEEKETSVGASPPPLSSSLTHTVPRRAAKE
jgi:hypothetical protein